MKEKYTKWHTRKRKIKEKLMKPITVVDCIIINRV